MQIDGTVQDVHDFALRLIADYARLLDDRDADAWSGLFIPGGGIRIGERQIVGREALHSFIERTPRGVHVPGVPAIESQGDELRCISSLVFIDAESGGIRAVLNTDRMAWHEGSLRFALREIEIRADTALV